MTLWNGTLVVVFSRAPILIRAACLGAEIGSQLMTIPTRIGVDSIVFWRVEARRQRLGRWQAPAQIQRRPRRKVDHLNHFVHDPDGISIVTFSAENLRDQPRSSRGNALPENASLHIAHVRTKRKATFLKNAFFALSHFGRKTGRPLFLTCSLHMSRFRRKTGRPPLSRGGILFLKHASARRTLLSEGRHLAHERRTSPPMDQSA